MDLSRLLMNPPLLGSYILRSNLLGCKAICIFNVSLFDFFHFVNLFILSFLFRDLVITYTILFTSIDDQNSMAKQNLNLCSVTDSYFWKKSSKSQSMSTATESQVCYKHTNIKQSSNHLSVGYCQENVVS